MEINKQEIVFNGSRNEWIYVIPLGDIHLGNAGCDKKKCMEMIKWIASQDNVFWIGLGDYIDCINYTDKRFDPMTVDPAYISNLSNCVPNQIEDILQMLYPIGDKCLGLHRGNHEEKIRLRYHYDVLYEMWKLMKVPLLKDSAITRITFCDNYKRKNKNKGGRYNFDIFSTHGCGGGRKGGNKINRLEDMITYVDADVYLTGHHHIKATETKSTLVLDKSGKLRCKKRILGVTGSYLHGYKEGTSSYIEKNGFPPTDTGVLKLMFNPRKRDVHVSE